MTVIDLLPGQRIQDVIPAPANPPPSIKLTRSDGQSYHPVSGPVITLAAAETGYIAIEQTKTIKTGTTVEIPHGYIGLICPVAQDANPNVSMTNSPMIVLPGAPVEIKITLTNHSPLDSFQYQSQPLAKLIVVPLANLPVEVV